MTLQPGPEQNLPLDALDRVDGVCVAFEAAWRQGGSPRIEEYLGAADRSERAYLLTELMALEITYRSRSGTAPLRAEYRDRFPADTELVELVYEQLDENPAQDTHVEAAGQVGRDTDGFSHTTPWPTDAHALGDYELFEVIGRGGMGVVYRARQSSADRIVALKIIQPERLAGSSVADRQAIMERFRNEALAVARLTHDNIVTLYEVGEADGHPYFSMQWIDGRDLDQELRRGPMAAPEAARIMEAVSRAVEYAHQQNVIHRDLKPRNILLDQRGRPYVVDFGLAKPVDVTLGLTQTGAWLGTPAYIAPEQATGGSVSAASDVYSLGATFYEMLTGRPPFAAASAEEVRRQALSDDPVSPRKLNPDVPTDLNTICLKCLRKDRRGRYQRAEDLASDLRRFLDGKPIMARPLSVRQRVGRWCRRNPAVATLAAALVLIVVGSFAGITSLWLLAEDRREIAESSEQRAQTSYRLAREALESVVGKIASDPRVKSGPLEDMKRLVGEAQAGFYEDLLELKGVEPEFRAERVVVYRRLGDLKASLGDKNEAMACYDQAEEISRALLREFPDSVDYRVDVLNTNMQKVGLLSHAAKHDQAIQLLQELIPEWDKLLAEFPDRDVWRQNLGSSHTNLGVMYFYKVCQQREGPPQEREELARRCQQAHESALEQYEQILERNPGEYSTQRRLAEACQNLGNLHWELKSLIAAESIFQKGVRVMADAKAAGKLDTPGSAALANCYNGLGTVYAGLGEPVKRRAALEAGVEVMSNLVANHPLVPQHQAHLGNMQGNLGTTIDESGDPAGSLVAFDGAIKTLEPVVAKDPQGWHATDCLRRAHRGRAQALGRLHRHHEALACWQRTVELDDPQYRHWYVLQRARTLARIGELGRAVEDAEMQLKSPPLRPATIYDAACVLALVVSQLPEGDPARASHVERAVALLLRAANSGYEKMHEAHADPDLDSLRSREEFQALLAGLNGISAVSVPPRK